MFTNKVLKNKYETGEIIQAYCGFMSLQTLEIFVFSRNGTHVLYREDKSRYYMVGYKK